MFRILWHKLTSLKPIRSSVKSAVRPISNKYSTLEKRPGLLQEQVKRPISPSPSSHAKSVDTSIKSSNQKKETDWNKIRNTYSGIHKSYLDEDE